MPHTAAASRILVTGGAGFIGSHVCEALLADGKNVVCLDDLSTGKRNNIAPLEVGTDFRFVLGDIRDGALLSRIMRDVDAVVHLAALGSVPRSIADPTATEKANLEGFLQVLDTARRTGVVRFVYASSSSVYGDARISPKQEGSEGRPLSPYAVTKLMDEVYARSYHRRYGMATIGLRFFNVFGERQDPEGPYAAAIPRFIHSFLQGASPVLHGDGLQTRDFTYVANAVLAVRGALATTDPAAAGEVMNVAYGATCDLLTLVGLVKERLARYVPGVVDIPVLHGPPRPGDVRDSLADVGKAQRLLHYAPHFTLAQGLDRAVPWYVAQVAQDRGA